MSRGSAIAPCVLPLIKAIKRDSAGSHMMLSPLGGVFHVSLIGDNAVSQNLAIAYAQK